MNKCRTNELCTSNQATVVTIRRREAMGANIARNLHVLKKCNIVRFYTDRE